MNKFSKAIETLKRWIGVEKRSCVQRRVKPSKRKKTNKRKSTRRKD